MRYFHHISDRIESLILIVLIPLMFYIFDACHHILYRPNYPRIQCDLLLEKYGKPFQPKGYRVTETISTVSLGPQRSYIEQHKFREEVSRNLLMTYRVFFVQKIMYREPQNQRKFCIENPAG